MKRVGKIITGVVLGIAFTLAVGFYCWQYDVGGIKNIFSRQEEESESIIQPKMKVPEIEICELGEEIECGDLIWKITSAEIVTDYNSLDDYYKKREYLEMPRKDLRGDLFEEETQFLVINLSVTNPSESQHLCTPGSMKIYNVYEDGSYQEVLGDYAVDYRVLSKQAAITDIFFQSIAVEAGETVEIEYVREFQEYGYGSFSYIYDLYIGAGSMVEGYDLWAASFMQRLHLDIAPKHLSIDMAESKDTYDEQRDILGMKRRQWVNLDMKQYQKEGYPELYHKLDVVKEFDEEVTEENYLFEIWSDVTSQIVNVQVVDWEELDKDFTDRGELLKTAERYEELYGYKKEELKILILDISIHRGNLEVETDSEQKDSKTEVNFYENSFLYTRDENEKRWVFGTADDWIVTKNSIEGGRTGHINAEWFLENQTVELRTAYLLPPEIYHEGALYFCGGEFKTGNFSGTPIQRIYLK